VDRFVDLPPGARFCSTVETTSLTSFTLNTLPTSARTHDISSRTTLATLSETVRSINAQVLSRVPNEPSEFFSTYAELDNGGEVIEDLMPEGLHDINRPALPLYRLCLKRQAIVIYLGNLSFGLCNGTRINVIDLHNHLIEGTLLTGPLRRKLVVLPSIITIDNADTQKVQL
jgi:ATP-dependent DNA helicase PIF1